MNRAVWSGNRALVERIGHTDPEVFAHLWLDGLTYRLKNPQEWDELLREAAAAALERRANAAAAAAAAAPRRHKRSHRNAMASIRRLSGLWRPRAAHAQLRGVRLLGPEGESVARKPREMFNAIREHWRPVFHAPPRCAAAADELLAHAHRWPFHKVRLPSIQAAAQITRRTPGTAPGPDGVPYAAWRAAGLVGATLLHGALLRLTAGELIPEFNDAWLVVLAKGHTMEDLSGMSSARRAPCDR